MARLQRGRAISLGGSAAVGGSPWLPAATTSELRVVDGPRGRGGCFTGDARLGLCCTCRDGTRLGTGSGRSALGGASWPAGVGAGRRRSRS
jgi:hypothetical protein